jgi:hypothetical protein
VPDEWLRGSGRKIGLNDYAISGGRLGYQLTTAGKTVTIQFTGAKTRPTAYSIELPGLRNNIANVSVRGTTINQPAGTIHLPSATCRVPPAECHLRSHDRAALHTLRAD